MPGTVIAVRFTRCVRAYPTDQGNSLNSLNSLNTPVEFPTRADLDDVLSTTPSPGWAAQMREEVAKAFAAGRLVLAKVPSARRPLVIVSASTAAMALRQRVDGNMLVAVALD